MTSVEPTSIQSIQYDQRTVRRAERAVRCAPFKVKLFTTMRWQSVELRAIAANEGVQNGYIQTFLPEIVVEAELLWLIQVGLLRREVDGQGLTDSFRLTPLGRQLAEKWQQDNDFPQPTLLDQFNNALSRWVRLPNWL